MINIDEARHMMPSNRLATIMDEVEELIVEAASNDEYACAIPTGFFGVGQEKEIIYNVKPNQLFLKVKEELEKQGFKIGKKDLQFFISWKEE